MTNVNNFHELVKKLFRETDFSDITGWSELDIDDFESKFNPDEVQDVYTSLKKGSKSVDKKFMNESAEDLINKKLSEAPVTPEAMLAMAKKAGFTPAPATQLYGYASLSKGSLWYEFASSAGEFLAFVDAKSGDLIIVSDDTGKEKVFPAGTYQLTSNALGMYSRQV